MANTKISALTANTNPNWSEEFVYAYNNANGKITLNTMKAFVWWTGISTLNADANIWELSQGIYETTYLLYYKSWETVPSYGVTWSTKKQMLFVVEESTGEKWFFVFNVWHKNTAYSWKASFGYSISSSTWRCYELSSWDESLKQYGNIISSWISEPEGLSYDWLTQVLEWVSGSHPNEITISASKPPYVWATYTIIVSSVTDAYSITLGTGVTNPLGITLPNNVNKKCVITLVPTSSTTAIVTSCTIAS